MYHMLIVEAKFYEDISEKLAQGAVQALEMQGASYERVSVPGAFEIPAAIRFAINKERYDGFVALGCVIRGQTSHYDVVAQESARGLQELVRTFNVAVGNGILTVDDMEQAVERANPKKRDLGGRAASAALQMVGLKHYFMLKPKIY